MQDVATDIQERAQDLVPMPNANLPLTAGSPELSEALLSNNSKALKRIIGSALREMDDTASMFLPPDRQRNQPGLAGAMRNARGVGINIQAFMEHISAEAAEHVKEKIAAMGPSFLKLSAGDLERLVENTVDDMDREDDMEESMIAKNAALSKKAQPSDDDAAGFSANFKRAADQKRAKEERARQQEIAEACARMLRKETIRSLFKDHEWKLALQLTFDVFKHPLLHFGHLLKKRAEKRAALTAPAPKAPA